MKRSEMIEGLKITFRQCRSKVISDEDMAYGFLKYIESLGMLPPAYKDPDLDGHRFGEATYRNEWEPEHESLPVDPKYFKQKIQDRNGRE